MKCGCKMKNRRPEETMREWLKRCWCMFHWMQSDYYQQKLEPDARTWNTE